MVFGHSFKGFHCYSPFGGGLFVYDVGGAIDLAVAVDGFPLGLCEQDVGLVKVVGEVSLAVAVFIEVGVDADDLTGFVVGAGCGRGFGGGGGAGGVVVFEKCGHCFLRFSPGIAAGGRLGLVLV